MDILQLIEELEDVLDDASSVPFSQKVAIDPDEMYEIIKEIRQSLPEEIRQAQWLNDEKDRILAEANQQAAEILQAADQQAKNTDNEMQRRFNELVNESSITKQASRIGEGIVADAEKQSRQIKESVFAYVDEILSNTQENLKSIIKELDNNRNELK